jgi:hypothetical protein
MEYPTRKILSAYDKPTLQHCYLVYLNIVNINADNVDNVKPKDTALVSLANMLKDLFKAELDSRD